MKRLLLLFLILGSFLAYGIEENPMVIVIPSYNNVNWYKINLDSVFSQKYSNFRVIYIDDHSSDRTRNLIEEYVKNSSRSYQSILFEEDASKEILATTEKFQRDINAERPFFSFISNTTRCGALANQYRAILSCQDEEIIVLLDGDDWLANDNVLEKLNSVYSTQNIWMTHGSLVEYPSGIQAWCEPIPRNIIANNAFRNFKCPSHLRTFYASIFKKIQLKDLLYKGDFFPMTSDMAIMYPIIEMCAERHQFISEPLYIYNMLNPINDNKVNADLQKTLDRLIRRKRPYSRLDNR